MQETLVSKQYCCFHPLMGTLWNSEASICSGLTFSALLSVSPACDELDERLQARICTLSMKTIYSLSASCSGCNVIESYALLPSIRIPHNVG